MSDAQAWAGWLFTGRLASPIDYLGYEQGSEQALGVVSEAQAVAGVELDEIELGSAAFELALELVVWRRVVGAAAFEFDFSADGGSYKNSQIATNAQAHLETIEARAMRAGILPLPTIKAHS